MPRVDRALLKYSLYMPLLRDKKEKEISNVVLSANVATVTTTAAHGYTTGNYITVNASDNVFDGSFVITGAPTTTTLTYANTYST